MRLSEGSRKQAFHLGCAIRCQVGRSNGQFCGATIVYLTGILGRHAVINQAVAGSRPTMPPRAVTCLSVMLAVVALASSLMAAPADPADVEKTGIIHVRDFDLPESSYLSRETRAALARQHALWTAASIDSCGLVESAARENMAEIRQCQAAAFYQTTVYKEVRDRYPVLVVPQEIGGVYTEVFTPVDGVAPKNKTRVLINLHGGGFLEGARSISHIESIPIASVAQIKVVSVDYRQAPENRFPAASEDVTAVYRQLLKTYGAKNIGIFGCSAGGLLTAETVAWLRKEHLPRPGAVGMFCMGASYTGKGDSSFIARAIEGSSESDFAKYFAYFEGSKPNDPLAYPVLSNQVMAEFPPSLLISGTRDHALSSVVYTHSRLVELGVRADLHVYEGMGHAFFYNPELPESREVYAVISKFFDSHLDR
jgi:epsilon-lactone hydrolase